MKFILTYTGPLKANGTRNDKHALRAHFDLQLQELWKQEPLLSHRAFICFPSNADINLIELVGGHSFCPLVSSKWHLTAELDITLLRPEPPGAVVTQSGDIDNRIKTLLDALRYPKVPQELPSGKSVLKDPIKMMCLLQDDNLISRLSVETERLLQPTGERNVVSLLIRVTTRPTRITNANMGIG